jgi:hypothetical protein
MDIAEMWRAATAGKPVTLARCGTAVNSGQIR